MDARTLRLVAITDDLRDGAAGLVVRAQAAVRGGATMIQLRLKDADARTLVEVARSLVKALPRAGDRERPARCRARRGRGGGARRAGRPAGGGGASAGAAGLHRRRVGGDATARSRSSHGADYVGIGPVYDTISKADAGRAIGPVTFSRLARACKLPAVAIGGHRRVERRGRDDRRRRRGRGHPRGARQRRPRGVGARAVRRDRRAGMSDALVSVARREALGAGASVDLQERRDHARRAGGGGGAGARAIGGGARLGALEPAVGDRAAAAGPGRRGDDRRGVVAGADRAGLGARRSALGNDTNAYRLVHGEADGVPSLVCDQLRQVAGGAAARVRASSDTGVRSSKRSVELVKPAGILARNDANVRDREGLPREIALLAGEVPREIEVNEHGVKYLAAPWDGQKTGAFLDQRENRVLAGSVARGRALDCFAYHGSFALHLARRGRPGDRARLVGGGARAREGERGAERIHEHRLPGGGRLRVPARRRRRRGRATRRSCSIRRRSRRTRRRCRGRSGATRRSICGRCDCSRRAGCCSRRVARITCRRQNSCG